MFQTTNQHGAEVFANMPQTWPCQTCQVGFANREQLHHNHARIISILWLFSPHRNPITHKKLGNHRAVPCSIFDSAAAAQQLLQSWIGFTGNFTPTMCIHGQSPNGCV